MEKVILVDQQDNAIGECEKIKAHEEGLLHRAFSVVIFRNASFDEILLQQRQQDKYHCAGLWTNTCCGHPRPNESIDDAAKRRLREEMGLLLDLKEIGVFQYRAPFLNGLVENEIDHVFIGVYNDEPFAVNDQEVADWRWVSIDEIQRELISHSERYTPWFKNVLNIVMKDSDR